MATMAKPHNCQTNSKAFPDIYTIVVTFNALDFKPHLLYYKLKDNQVHWIQAPFTYLQSPHNHPTFISA